ncbi:hypothetical protein MNV84_03973 [Leishmania braziliensis]|nr:hypothetical protein MNV84_03973 [Leishmania braziliensis]
MSRRHHLLSRREVIALFSDFDDATVNLTDMALPAPPQALASSGGVAASAYLPPFTRLDVVREALVAFVCVKLRSVPSTALLTFGLYVVRADSAKAEGQDNGEVEVEELLTPGPAGEAGGCAVQAAIKDLDPSVWGPSNSDQSSFASSSPMVYTGVMRCLKRLLEEAEQAQQQPPDQAAMRMSKSASVAAFAKSSSAGTKGTRASLSSSWSPAPLSTSLARRGPPATATAGNPEACAVVHGIVLRSRLTPPAPPSSYAQGKASTTLCNTDGTTTITTPRCWLDIVSLAPLGNGPPTELSCFSNTSSSVAAAVPYEHTPLLFTELNANDSCTCALLDPVELTGISHRGLALGPALTRLISLQERRTGSFVHRSLAVVDIFACATASADPGSVFLLDHAASNDSVGATSQQQSSTSPKLRIPTAAAKSFTAQLAIPPQSLGSSVAGPCSALPSLLAIQASNGNTSSAQPLRILTPVGTTHHSLPAVIEQRSIASAARLPRQPNPRRPSKNSGTVAPVGVGLPESLTMFKEDVEVDLAVTRHYTVPAEISSASPKAATNAPVLQLHQIITYATPTQRGRAPAASNPSGESAVKGPSRFEPKPPHQQHRHADVRSGGVMTATTQTQLSTAATTSSQRQCQSTLQLQPGATPVLVAPSIPFPLTHLPHPPTAAVQLGNGAQFAHHASKLWSSGYQSPERRWCFTSTKRQLRHSER